VAIVHEGTKVKEKERKNEEERKKRFPWCKTLMILLLILLGVRLMNGVDINASVGC